MFFLATLLASFADGASARAARATTHELARRLQTPVEAPEVPVIGWMLLRLTTAMLRHGEAWTWPTVESRNATMLRVLYPIERKDSPTFRWVYLDEIDHLLQQFPIEELRGRRVLFPAEDAARPDTPHVRGPPDRDALLWAYVRAVDGWAAESVPDRHAAIAFLNDLPSILDWVEATRPALASLTLPRIRALSVAWHAQFKGVGFGDPLPPGWIVLRWPDGWTLQRLTEKKDLALEGESMAHCVGGPPRANGRRDGESSYWQAVRAGGDTIFSLRNPAGMPVATLQGATRSRRILQVQGPEDERPEPNVQTRLVEALWALGVFKAGLQSGQPLVHNVGTSRVWTDDEAYASSNVEKALGWLDAANTDLAAIRKGALHKEAVERAIDRTLHYVVTYLTMLQDETGGANPFAIPRSRFSRTPDRFWLSAKELPLENPEAVLKWDSDNGPRILRMFGVGDRFRFAIEVDGVVTPLGENLLDGIRALMDWQASPPDVSFVEVLAPLPLIWSDDMAAVRTARAAQAPRLRGPG